jgi:hypothetical protein
MANWVVDQTERFGGVNRAPRINPYLPGRTERLGARVNLDAPATLFSTKEIGKPVKLSGDTCVLCADGDLPYGFVEAVNVGTSDGWAIGTVLCDPGHEVLAVDEVGDLAVGDMVKAGTPTALGTATPALGAKVKKYTGAVSTGQSALLTSTTLAIGTSSKKAVKVTNASYALVGGQLVAISAAEVPLTGISIADSVSNAIGIFVNAAGELSAVAGTAHATVAGIVLPQANATRALLGYVVITNDGGVFTGGTTDLDAATVTDVYINTVGPIAQADQIAGPHFWQVLAYYGAQGAGKQVMLRKV